MDDLVAALVPGAHPGILGHVAERERLGLSLRAIRSRSHLGPAPPALLGLTLIVGCVDADTGELHPITVVIDNGPAIESVAAACWFAHRPHFASWPEPDSVHSRDYALLVVGRWSALPDSELRQERCRVDL